MKEIIDVVRYDIQQQAVEDLCSGQLTLKDNERVTVYVECTYGDRCDYTIYTKFDMYVVVIVERRNDVFSSVILHGLGKFYDHLRRIRDELHITRISVKKQIVETGSFFDQKKMISFIRNVMQRHTIKTSTNVNISLLTEICSTNVDICKMKNDYIVSLNTMMNNAMGEDQCVVEFIKATKKQHRATALVVDTVKNICPYMNTLVTICIKNTDVTMDLSRETGLYKNVCKNEYAKEDLHEELLQVAWNPSRLEYVVGEQEYKEIVSNWK